TTALAFASGGTNQNLSLAGTGTGSVVVNDGFGILEGGASPSFYTVFQGGDQSGDVTYTLPTAQGAASTFLQNNGSGVLSWAASSGTDTVKTHITMYSTQASTITKSNPADTVNVTNLGTTPVGFGSNTIINMDGFTTIRLMMRGANTGAQTGTVTVKVVNLTDSTDLVSLTYSDTTVQFREATASISLTGLKKLGIQSSSSTTTDDPTFGDIAIQLEK
ncbi:MAG: hypothetical protein HY350_02580, partial [Candidatus Omnitrophica bacterium]|nr:hypothetical protein [Candidatus Omnitrophota bacterium]